MLENRAPLPNIQFNGVVVCGLMFYARRKTERKTRATGKQELTRAEPAPEAQCYWQQLRSRHQLSASRAGGGGSVAAGGCERDQWVPDESHGRNCQKRGAVRASVSWRGVV